MPFRVRMTPDPIATVNNKNEGFISKTEIIEAQGVFAEIPNFDFDLKFKVLSFTLSTTKGGFNNDISTNGARFSQQQLELIKGLSKGSRLVIENINAKGEDGFERNLSPMSFKIN